MVSPANRNPVYSYGHMHAQMRCIYLGLIKENTGNTERVRQTDMLGKERDR